jgi:hypothetical protein
LDGSLVNNYRSFNVLGMGQVGWGLLYHKFFSSNLPGFNSENEEITAVINQTEQSLTDFEGAKTWVIDLGFDNGDVWWEIWKHPGSHLATGCTTWNALWSGKRLVASGKKAIWVPPSST